MCGRWRRGLGRGEAAPAGREQDIEGSQHYRGHDHLVDERAGVDHGCPPVAVCEELREAGGRVVTRVPLLGAAGVEALA